MKDRLKLDDFVTWGKRLRGKKTSLKTENLTNMAMEKTPNLKMYPPKVTRQLFKILFIFTPIWGRFPI